MSAQPRWWSIRPAQNRKPATYRCPLCGNHLPALSLDPKRPGMPSVIFGAVLILVMVALPTGVGGFLRRIFGPLTSRLYSRW